MDSPVSHEKIDVAIISNADPRQIRDIYIDAGWWESEYDKNISFLDRIVMGSFCFVGAFDESGRLVGMGRALSDGCSDAYIQDISVLKSHRGKGIGRRIVRKIVEHLNSCGVDWIGLVGEPGTEKFYRSMHFNRMQDFIPMIYRPGKELEGGL